ncbi:MAG: hypothetical protein IGR93_12645 [Hydrococcus sp. C42_A2020_068]|uniref:hypothetical protein n=1 Tax=Pleurocapsa sp. PCC 7327 TaxID=118163 RepID=UPI00029FF474|nr:hypothetical protein [Pleurocapsa sp. PCC 7327]AFY76767.1 hypothetical protein Ple7327_1380 [Pleurocapsa sp. PCC 7327]MBF2020920.1 hypothetical protein [Hydrococcus sp. C42_A2020_068]
MNTSTSLKRKESIKTSTIILFAFATAFFPRLLDSAGAPSIVNFFHFVAVPFAFIFALVKTRPTDRKQIAVVKQLLVGLWILLTVGFASALWNGAGAVNVVFGFLLLAEPFMLLIATISLPMSSESLERIRGWMTGFVFFHLFLIYVQYGLGFCHLPGDCDNIQGVFYRSGSGHVVGASVSCTFAIYYFVTAKTKPMWLRASVLVAGFLNIQLADAKQIVPIFALAFLILAIANVEQIGKALLYIIGIILFIVVFLWAVQNIEALSGFTTWARPEMYGPDGEATKLKLTGIRTIVSYFRSPVNWLFGLGPGHTVSRMGGWMLRDYSSLLSPLGATRVPIGETVPVSEIVWKDVAESWLANGSSFFAPFWGWAGIWGDFGFIGLGAYLYLCSIVWRRLCLDDLPKYFMLTVFVCGLIFTQMEEPAYMLYIASLIGLRWQEHQINKRIYSRL